MAAGGRSTRTSEVLAELVSVHDAPRPLRSDNGPELDSSAVMKWLAEEGIETACCAPGKRSLSDTGRRHDNEVRPHASLAYLTPIELKARNAQQSNRPPGAMP